MTRRFSDVFNVSSQQLADQGALDGFVDIDSPFHIDPYLLAASTMPELVPSRQRFDEYFENVIRLLLASQRPGDRMYRAAAENLVFRETPNTSLGYSRSGSSGRGIGRGLARRMTVTANEIVKAGIHDPVIFELVGLFEPGIGADRISDMTMRIFLPDVLAFSKRVARELEIPSREFEYADSWYQLPFDPETQTPVFLVPTDILRDLPTANDWSDVDYVAAYNENLRRAVNELIGHTWRNATRQVPKRQLKDAILRYPELLQDLIDLYTAKDPEHYDFDVDRLGMLKWHETALEFARNFPLRLTLSRAPTAEEILGVVLEICRNFKRLIEHNGLNRLLFDDQGNRRREIYAQLLFYGISDTYCEANNIDLAREHNGGRGPVDFKFSHGYRARVSVEIKFSSNSHLVRDFTTQLPIYNQADRTDTSVYLVIRDTRSLVSIEKLRVLRRREIAGGRRSPEIVVVDGRLLPTASHA